MVDGSMFKNEYIHDSPQKILSAKNMNEQLFIDWPSEDSVTSLKDSYKEKIFGCNTGS